MGRNKHTNRYGMHAERFSNSLEQVLDNLEKTGREYKQAISTGADFFLASLFLWLAYSLCHGHPFSDF